MNIQPDAIGKFIYKGEVVNTEWYSVTNKDEIPDYPWKLAHLIGDLDGLTPLVLHKSGNFGLVGGHVEEGEGLDQTLHRETREEVNCENIEWWPIGYQVARNEKYSVSYQFRAFARLRKVGEFHEDIGGTVVSYELIERSKINDFLGWEKDIVGAMLASAERYFA